LSNQWADKERTLFRDANVLADFGFDVEVMGIKGAPLLEKLLPYQKDISFKEINYIPSTALLNWGKLKGLFKNLEQYSYIHCYEISTIWPICFFLRNYPQIPVSLFLNKELVRSYKKVWYRPLSTRIDGLIVPSDDFIENVWSQVRVHPRKCYVNQYVNWKKSKNLKLDKETFNIGLYISPLSRDTKGVDSACSLINVLNKHDFGKRKVIFHFYMDEDIGSSFLSDNIEHYIKGKFKDLNSYKIHKFKGENLNFLEVNMWLELGGSGQLTYLFDALGSGIPVLISRGICTSNLFFKYPFIGETYRTGDFRELSQKVLKIIKNHSKYLELIEKKQADLKKSLGADTYSEGLVKFFKGLKKRRKIFERRTKVYR